MEASRGQLEKATCQSVLLQGEARAMDGYENVLVHTRSWDFRITSVIENKVLALKRSWLFSYQAYTSVLSHSLFTQPLDIPLDIIFILNKCASHF